MRSLCRDRNPLWISVAHPVLLFTPAGIGADDYLVLNGEMWISNKRCSQFVVRSRKSFKPDTSH